MGGRYQILWGSIIYNETCLRFLVQLNGLLRYSETLLRRESNGQITTNSNIHKSHSHSGNKPEVDRGRRPLVIATALCGVFFIAG